MNIFGNQEVEKKEDEFYLAYLDKALDYVDGKGEGVQFKQLSVACGNVAKMRQSRSSTASLKYKIQKSQSANGGK